MFPISLIISPVLRNYKYIHKSALITFLKKEKAIYKNINTIDEEILHNVSSLCQKPIHKDEILKKWEELDLPKEFSDDPLNEILSTIKLCRFPRCNSEQYIILTVTANTKESEIAIGYISVLIDSRIKLFDAKALFFVGIRKTFSYFIAQKLGMKQQLPKITSILIPHIEELARFYNIKYIFTFPLNNMYHILKNHYEFKALYSDDELDNDNKHDKLQIEYFSPCTLLITDGEDDSAVWKLLT